MERVTKESKVVVEIDLDGTGQTDIATGVPFFDHMLDALGKHGAFDLTVRADGRRRASTPTTPSRTSRSCSARRCARRWATSGASAASATPGSRWTRRSRTPSSTSRAGPTRVHTGEPEFMRRLRRRRALPDGAQPARVRVAGLPRPPRAARAGAGRAATRTTSPRPQFKAIARALRAATEPRPADHRHPVHQGRPVKLPRGRSPSPSGPSARGEGLVPLRDGPVDR